MWTLERLQDKDVPQVCINGNWVPARPLNYTKKCLTFKERFKRAWLVFTCKADCFVWPENQ